jgi:hypothetical protein
MPEVLETSGVFFQGLTNVISIWPTATYVVLAFNCKRKRQSESLNRRFYRSPYWGKYDERQMT